ncbi:MAG: hypothetical protein WCO35_01135 [Candidatus Nomurabacteria bacterium]
MNSNLSIYKDGEKITGNEHVIKTEVIAGATCYFISELCFKVSTEDLVLLQDNTEAINVFSKLGDREENVLNEWPKAKILPNWIYFVKKGKHISSNEVEKLYEEIMLRVELNVIAAFNSKYPEFHKSVRNGIQIKNSKGDFCSAVFGCWPEDSSVHIELLHLHDSEYEWGFYWWFPGFIK